MSSEVTGGIGFQPHRLKFKGNKAITNRQLQEERATIQIQNKLRAQLKRAYLGINSINLSQSQVSQEASFCQPASSMLPKPHQGSVSQPTRATNDK